MIPHEHENEHESKSPGGQSGQGGQAGSSELFAPERVAFGMHRTQCDCPHCVGACVGGGGMLDFEDLQRLMPRHIEETGRQLEWARVHLRASLGSLARGTNGILRVGCLVPAPKENNGENGKVGCNECHWLENGRCRVHDDSPFGCAFYCNHKHNRETEERTALLSLMYVRRKYDLIVGRKYASDYGFDQSLVEQYERLWSALWAEGLRAVHPTVTRLLRLAWGEYIARQKERSVGYGKDEDQLGIVVEEIVNTPITLLENLIASGDEYMMYSLLHPKENEIVTRFTVLRLSGRECGVIQRVKLAGSTSELVGVSEEISN